MNKFTSFRRSGAFLALAFFLVAVPARAQTVTQTVVLQPGWNAVFLEVQPPNNRAETVFANLPVSSVWARAERLASAEFIQDASEELFNQPGWLAWLHPSRPDAFLGNLYAVIANQAYLIHATNNAPVTWNIIGRPSLRKAEWVPDAFNLRGLPVDPTTPPTFVNFLRHSAAHFDSTTGQLQKIYKLSPSGQWSLAAATDAIRSGEAYWIFSKGASDYRAPLDVELELGDGMNFGTSLTDLDLRLHNRTGSSLNIAVQELTPSAAGVMAYRRFETTGSQWVNLPSPLVTSPAPNRDVRVRLAIRRQNFGESQFSSLLRITDGAGTRIFVPVAAEKEAIGGFFAASTSARPHAGLWAGSVSISGVSEPRSATPTIPTAVRSPLNLRVIIHVDGSGQARLLKEVTQMWRNGTHTNDASGDKVLDKPGEYVLLTDETLIPLFSGATLRDGTPAGRRLSTVGYDFPAGSSNNFVELAGTFAVSNSLSGNVALPHDAPTNPFLHRYHPDHDDLDESFSSSAGESFAVSRQIQFSFTAAPPDGNAAPDFGYNEMGGTYRETINGIHKNAIYLSGTFRLTRASTITVLNPSPTP